jgi:glutamate racemase
MKYLLRSFIALLLLIYGCQTNQHLGDAEKLAKFFGKKQVNILVTDSGLGGLSVAADIFERFKGSGVFEKVNITFFNAQPHIKSGYNSMDNTEQKIKVFENALNAIKNNFDPDLILIACNTLSVLYPLTSFSKNTKIPVIGIVETGVDQITEVLNKDTLASVLIFATETTVNQNTHKKMLIDKGISENIIYTQACPKLAGSIERGTESEETLDLVEKYVNEALNKIPESEKPIFVSFNCTHYGYINDKFAAEFNKKGRPANKFIDPNPRMADFIFQDNYINRYNKTEVMIKIVSQPELTNQKIESIGSLIEKTSPETAKALHEYEFTPELFEWKSIAHPEGK